MRWRGGGGEGAMVAPSPMDLKSDYIKEIACSVSVFWSFGLYCLQLKIIVTFRRHAFSIIPALCLVDSSDIYI